MYVCRPRGRLHACMYVCVRNICVRRRDFNVFTLIYHVHFCRKRDNADPSAFKILRRRDHAKSSGSGEGAFVVSFRREIRRHVKRGAIEAMGYVHTCRTLRNRRARGGGRKLRSACNTAVLHAKKYGRCVQYPSVTHNLIGLSPRVHPCTSTCAPLRFIP